MSTQGEGTLTPVNSPDKSKSSVVDSSMDSVIMQDMLLKELFKLEQKDKMTNRRKARSWDKENEHVWSSTPKSGPRRVPRREDSTVTWPKGFFDSNRPKLSKREKIVVCAKEVNDGSVLVRVCDGRNKTKVVRMSEQSFYGDLAPKVAKAMHDSEQNRLSSLYQNRSPATYYSNEYGTYDAEEDKTWEELGFEPSALSRSSSGFANGNDWDEGQAGPSNRTPQRRGAEITYKNRNVAEFYAGLALMGDGVDGEVILGPGVQVVIDEDEAMEVDQDADKKEKIDKQKVIEKKKNNGAMVGQLKKGDKRSIERANFQRKLQKRLSGGIYTPRATRSTAPTTGPAFRTRSGGKKREELALKLKQVIRERRNARAGNVIVHNHRLDNVEQQRGEANEGEGNEAYVQGQDQGNAQPPMLIEDGGNGNVALLVGGGRRYTCANCQLQRPIMVNPDGTQFTAEQRQVLLDEARTELGIQEHNHVMELEEDLHEFHLTEQRQQHLYEMEWLQQVYGRPLNEEEAAELHQFIHGENGANIDLGPVAELAGGRHMQAEKREAVVEGKVEQEMEVD